jgi:hypothetical protein
MIMEEVRQYGRRDLIDAYLATRGERSGGYRQESSAYNAALRAYWDGMLDGLERLFEIRLSHREVGNAALFMLFESTTRSLLAITTPWSDFLEAGLLHRKLDETGEVGARVMAASDRIWARAEETREDHREILDALLTVFLGDRAGRTFSAGQLQALGVDLQRPDSIDYDYD